MNNDNRGCAIIIAAIISAIVGPLVVYAGVRVINIMLPSPGEQTRSVSISQSSSKPDLDTQRPQPSPNQPSSPSRPSGITVSAGGTFSPTAGWTWICTGDFSVIRSDGNEIVLHDDLENTGLVLVLEQNSAVTVKAPYGGRCEPFLQEEESNAISTKVSYLMNGEGCGETCSKVNVKELNTHGDVMRDYWRP